MADGKINIRATKPTLKTISQISGLAVPTVSRALNDAPDIGQNTKNLVRKIAEEIGYVPNRAGVRLRTGRTNVISLVMSTEHDMMNHTARLISSVAGGLRDTPFHLIVTPYFPSEDPMRPVRYIVESGSADAIILNQTKPEDPRIAYLLDRGFPFATHGRSNWAEKHPYYDFDNTAFGEIAVRQLHKRGRQKVVVIAPPTAQNYAQNILSGVFGQAQTCGMIVDHLTSVTSDSASEEIAHAVRQRFVERPELDSIICASTSAAMAAVGAVEGLGLRLGQDVDLFTKEAIPFLKLFRADILTVSEQVGSAGEFLAQAAIKAIRSPNEPPMQFLEVPQEP